MKNYDKNMVVTGAVLAAVTIAIGALGAHALKDHLDDASLAIFETGVRYQMYHVLAIIILGFATGISEKGRRWIAGLFLIGILLFSGSIYLLSLNSLLETDVRFLGPLTPIGGACFIFGWLMLAYRAFTLK